MKIPLLEQQTRGEPDAELEDLKTALVQAKKVHDIEGVVCGALFSQYQRDRMERVCEELGLVLFAPLWHKPQEAQLVEVLDKGYEVVIVSTAADGLDKSFLGKPLTKEDIDRLKRVPGVNIAGEGGEYETLVTFAPFFDKRIELGKTTIKEDKHTSLLVVEEAALS
jgi:asparagine synthase (glutamine-hydrolysing)